MLFTELVLQGVRNFEQMYRLPMGRGYSVFVGGPGSGKTSIVDVFIHLLYPDTTDPATQAFRSPGSDACRVALTMQDDDGQVYRLVKDLFRGSTALTRLDPASNQFAPVSDRPAEILQFLSASLHVPHRDVFEGLFVLRATDLPSKAPKVAAPGYGEISLGGSVGDQLGVGLPPGGGGGDGPSFRGYTGDDSGADEEVLPDNPEELRRQVQSLEQDIATSKELDSLQFKLDGLQNELFNLNEKLGQVEEFKERVGSLENRLKPYAPLKELPGDFEARIREFEQNQARYDRDKGRLADDRSNWERKAEQAVPGKLIHERKFLIGMGLGFGGLILGVLGLMSYEPLRWAAFLDIAGFGLVLVTVFQHIDQTMFVERNKRRLDAIDERKKKLDREFELETSMVRRTMEQVDVESVSEILEKFNERGKILNEQNALKEKLKTIRSDQGLAEVETRRDVLKKEIDEVEERLAGSAGMMMSVRDMENRLESLQEKLAMLDSGQHPVEAAPASSVAAPAPETSGQAQGPHATQRMMKLAADLFITDLDSLGTRLQARTSQYLGALSNQAYSQIVFGAGGTVSCVSAATNQALPVGQLEPVMQDLCSLALRMSILEHYGTQQVVPVLLDDSFSDLSAYHDLLGRMLSVIGQSGQVLLFASDAQWATHASASSQLG